MILILGRDILIYLVLNLRLSDHVIKSDDGPFKGSTAPMVDLGAYEFKYLNTGGNTPEELFINAYTEEVYDSEHARTATKLLSLVLYAK